VTLAEDVEVVRWHDPEEIVDLVEHRPVLTGHDDHGLDVHGCGQRRDDGCHFDRLRAGAVDDENFGHQAPFSRGRTT
jgi:hypothetical protein